MATTYRKNSNSRTKSRTTSRRGRTAKNVKTKRYSGCSYVTSYKIQSGKDAGVTVDMPCYSIWRKDRGQPIITGVGSPHKDGHEVYSKKNKNLWWKYCFTIMQGVTKQLTTGFVNPRNHTIHLPYLGNGFIASPTMGKGKGGAFFHPTGKKR